MHELKAEWPTSYAFNSILTSYRWHTWWKTIQKRNKTKKGKKKKKVLIMPLVLKYIDKVGRCYLSKFQRNYTREDQVVHLSLVDSSYARNIFLYLYSKSQYTTYKLKMETKKNWRNVVTYRIENKECGEV